MPLCQWTPPRKKMRHSSPFTIKHGQVATPHTQFAIEFAIFSRNTCPVRLIKLVMVGSKQVCAVELDGNVARIPWLSAEMSRHVLIATSIDGLLSKIITPSFSSAPPNFGWPESSQV